MAAYQSASALLAPYHFKMQRSEAAWLTDKTIFAGGFSRYATDDIKNIQEIDNTIAILTGRGGTSIDLKFINHLADTCRSWRVEVIGILNEDYTQLPENVVLYGHLPDPIKILRRAKIVIGNAGHNSVMEMASMNKRFIVIPEKRPFDEQIDKAELLEELGLATVVQPNQLYDTNWKRLLSDTTRSVPDWRDLIDNDAVGRAADGILSVYRSIYV
ncbi:hypothetical protein LJ707_10255 [Mucilaginibacter sp. UR6-1]|uniref:glycosyltransferase n=1 Tax=Mucilaginibacter sp. UR6-1 TaxID=1435643 RepID=UPI001E542018|nr:glycosyltransferase [Mucilaginibacter sp. UR6-1]MCC8409316.1 hypothetical protein [Mucilaginibacter sp. UR6-1]